MKKPKLPPLIVKKSPSAYYLYTYKNKWNSQKKRSERISFKKVGTVMSGQKEGRIRWDESFLEDCPELRGFVCERKGTKYSFTPVEDSGMTLSQVLQVRQLHAGATWALDQIVSQTPIGIALKKVFPDRRDYLKILSLAYFIILNRNNNISNYPTFAEVTRLPWAGEVNPSTIGRIFKRIKKDQIEKYFAQVQSALVRQKEKNGDTDKLTLALDSTSISSYSKKLSCVERGRNKDEDNLPQVNLLMLVDSRTALPIFYRYYDGNVPDVQTIRQVIADNARVGLKDVVLVSDKGYCSNKNIDDCLRNNVSFLFNMKCAVKGSAAQQLIDEEAANLRDINRMGDDDTVFQITRKLNWSYEPQPVKGKKSTKKTRDEVSLYWHLYFDPSVWSPAYQGLLEKVHRIMRKLKTKGTLDDNEQCLFEEIFEKKEQDGIISYLPNNEKLDRKLRYKGYRVLLSDEIKDAGKAWNAYQERWIVEDTFKTLKSRLGCSRARVSDDSSLNGKIFIQFLATSISMVIRARLRKYNETCKEGSVQLLYGSDAQILSRLNNIMQTKFQGGYYFGEIAGKRRRLFEALSVPVPDADPERETIYEDYDDEVAQEEAWD